MQLIVLPVLRPRPAENAYYNSMIERKDPLFSGLNDDSDEVAEEDTVEDFAKLAEKVSSLVWGANIFHDPSIRILLDYTFELYLFG